MSACPVCGGEDIRTVVHFDAFQAYCEACDYDKWCDMLDNREPTNTQAVFGYGWTEEEAVAEWHRAAANASSGSCPAP